MRRKKLSNPSAGDWRSAIISAILTLALMLGYDFMEERDRTERARRIRAERGRDKGEAITEYLRRRAITNAKSSETATGSETASSTPEEESPYTGRYKDMALKEVQTAIRRNRDWHLRNEAGKKRRRDHVEKLHAHSRVLLKSGDEKLAAMLTALAHLSPEQLDYTRQALLKTYPAADVDTLLHAIAKHADTNTPEPLNPDIQNILKAREIYEIIERELAIEWEAIRRERWERKPDSPLNSVLVDELTSGHYHKDMTLIEAQDAARRHSDWHLWNEAVKKRRRDYIEKLHAQSRILLASGDEKLAAMLTALAHLSPEQLDYARQALLKTYPAADVDALLHAIAKHENTNTPEPLNPDVQNILKGREIYEITERELAVEWEAIQREQAEVKRTSPF